MKRHFNETRESFIKNGQNWEYKELPRCEHALILKDNDEVWFYYDEHFNLKSIRAYEE